MWLVLIGVSTGSSLRCFLYHCFGDCYCGDVFVTIMPFDHDVNLVINEFSDHSTWQQLHLSIAHFLVTMPFTKCGVWRRYCLMMVLFYNNAV